MKPINTKERRYSKMLFAGLYIASLGLMLCVISALTEPATSTASTTNTTLNSKEEQAISTIDELMHTQLQQMQIASANYISALQQNPGDDNVKSTLERLMESEELLNGTIKKAITQSNDLNEENRQKLTNISKAFDASLQSEKMNRSNILNPLPIGKVQTGNAEELWKANVKQKADRIAQLEEQLNMLNSTAIKTAGSFQEKDNRIKLLEQQLKSRPAQSEAAVSTQVISQYKNEIKNKDARIIALEQQLKAKPANSEAGVSTQTIAQYRNDLKNKDARIIALEKQIKNKTQTVGTEGIDKLKDDNKYLTLALTSQARQTNSLIEANKNLRFELERLRNQSPQQRSNR